MMLLEEISKKNWTDWAENSVLRHGYIIGETKQARIFDKLKKQCWPNQYRYVCIQSIREIITELMSIREPELAHQIGTCVDIYSSKWSAVDVNFEDEVEYFKRIQDENHEIYQ